MNIGTQTRIHNANTFEFQDKGLSKERGGVLIQQVRLQMFLLEHALGLEQRNNTIKIHQAIQYLQQVEESIRRILERPQRNMRQFAFGDPK